MSSWVDWDIEEEYGENPLGKPGLFEFRVGYYIEPGCRGVMYTPNGDGYPGHAPSFVMEGVDCVGMRLENESARRPTHNEQDSLCEWFQQYLDARPSEMKELENRAFEYSYLEPDYDDLDD